MQLGVSPIGGWFSSHEQGSLVRHPIHGCGQGRFGRISRNDMKMYVGNLAWAATGEDLKDLFSQYGEVADVYVPTDRDSGRPRGFAFVTMGSKEAMEAAIKGADGLEFQGRDLRVNEARPRDERGGGGGGYRG